MPQFRYRALNSQGHELEGTLTATDANAAVTQLSRQGLRLRSIEEGVTVARVPAPASQLPPRMAAQSAPTVRASKVPLVARPLQATPRRTAPAKNDELFFLFAQLSNLIRGGIAAPDSLNTIASRSQNAKFREPLLHMAHLTAEGGSLADAMEHFPDLFSPGHSGAVRAGEKGGYLPDALHVMSEQCKETHKLMRAYWWLGIAVIVVVVTFAIAFTGSIGIDRLILSINEPNNPANSLPAAVRDALLGPIGFGLLLFFVFYFWTKHWLRQTSTRMKRHSATLRVPLVGKRASSENLSLFSWHLNQLQKAGLSPFASWRLAASAVPNIAYSERLLAVGDGMNEGTKYSALFYKSDLFPREVSAIVETGEVTGDIATSLEQAMDYSRAEQKTADTTLKVKAGCWAGLLLFGGGMIAFLIMYISYLTSAFKVLE